MDNAAPPPSESIDITTPPEQEGTRAVVQSWLCADGATVAKDAPLVELETDKVVMEVAAPTAGVVEILLAEGEPVAPGSVLGRIHADARKPGPEAPSTAAPSASKRDASPGSAASHNADRPLSRFDPELRLSPAVRKLLSENHLDPSELRGTGKGGRLTREDVVAHLQRRSAGPPSSPVTSATPATAPIPTATPGGPALAESRPHDTMRRRIADHMQHSVSTAPHVTAVFEADFSAIIAHRKRHKEEYAREGVNLTFTAYFLAACVAAMRAVPEVNSRWHADQLDIYRDINIGIGTAIGKNGGGLIVPVLKQAQERSLIGIARELQRLTEAARENTLKPTDVQGGTFTLSNHGVSGSLLATPIIINQPQSAILGIGALEKRVVVRDVDDVDTLQIRPLAYVSLTIDHRVIDGAATNAWLNRFCETLENWD